MIQSKSYGLQNETRQYLRRLYAYGRELAPTDVADIDNFVKGLKQLNLWHKIICYPLRSIHNLGSGARVLSLGGLDQADGTLVNSPSWGTTGLVATYTPSIQTMFSILKKPYNFNNSLWLCGAGNGGPQQNFWQGLLLQNVDTSGQALAINDGQGSGALICAQGTTTRTANLTNPYHNSSNFINTVLTSDPSSSILRLRILTPTETNTTTTIPTSLSQRDLTRIQLNGRWQGSYVLGVNMTFSFCAMFSPSIDSQYSDFNRLLRTTIGKGLGLP